jgi:hypothetical protein
MDMEEKIHHLDLLLLLEEHQEEGLELEETANGQELLGNYHLD